MKKICPSNCMCHYAAPRDLTRPLETFERYWVYLGEPRISAFFLARPSCVSISQELYPPKSYIMWCCNTLLHYFPFQRAILRDLLLIMFSTVGIQRQLVISSAAIYSLVRTLTVHMSIILIILERSEGCSCHLLQALNSKSYPVTTTLVNSELFANCFGFSVCFTSVTCFSYLPTLIATCHSLSL